MTIEKIKDEDIQQIQHYSNSLGQEWDVSISPSSEIIFLKNKINEIIEVLNAIDHR